MERKSRILIVEDEVDVLEANSSYFRGIGYEVYTATTLDRARSLIWEHPPDLMILDILLPDGTGLDFCKEFRKISAAPVIYLTCLDDDGNMLKGLQSGAEDYLTKPYNIEVLAAKVSIWLRQSHASKWQLSMPPLFVERGTGCVLLSGRKISLTPKELHVLCYLIEHRGKDISQEELYASIWQAPADTIGLTVRMTVSRLRQKMNFFEDGHFDLMTTKAGGYVFLKIKNENKG